VGSIHDYKPAAHAGRVQQQIQDLRILANICHFVKKTSIALGFNRGEFGANQKFNWFNVDG